MSLRGGPGLIPAELSSFVGRGEELSEVRRLVTQSRLVTLAGTGGVGKSRLARRVAGLLQRTFRDGACLVNLSDVSDQSMVADAVASSLGVPEHSSRGALGAIQGYLAQRQTLLVLDNCAHVAEAVRALLDALLRFAPGLHVLVTSREVLGLEGEVVFRVEPLALPSEQDLASAAEVSPAVVLFVERSAAVVPGFAPSARDMTRIVDICRRLDGLPLALELAAAQLPVVSLAELDHRLADRFRLLSSRRSVGRHRSLRAVVDETYELCEKRERELWQRLSVFAGEFDLADAEHVSADETLPQADVLPALCGLVDKSVVSVRVVEGDMRYRLINTLRQYGRDRLTEDARDGVAGATDEYELRIRHLEWYTTLACEFEAAWFGPGQPARLSRLRGKLPDLRAALEFAVGHPDHVRSGLRMAGALCWFWLTTALREGRSWLPRLLELDRAPTRDRSRALSALAVELVVTGSFDGAAEVAREALEIARREDVERVPRVLHNLGMVLAPLGDPEGMAALEESLAECHKLGLVGEELAYSTYTLGYGLGVTGDPAGALVLIEKSIELCQQAGDIWWQGGIRTVAALMAWNKGEVDRARELALDGLRLGRQLDDMHSGVLGVNHLGLLLAGREDRKAATLLGAADRYWADAGGSHLELVFADRVAEAKTLARTNLGDAGFEAAYAAGYHQSMAEAAAFALDEPTVLDAGARPPRDQSGLTRREHEVAALVVEGLTNRGIAARLVLSTRTAETHVQNMLAKTGLGNRSQLAVWYAGLGEGPSVGTPT